MRQILSHELIDTFYAEMFNDLHEYDPTYTAYHLDARICSSHIPDDLGFFFRTLPSYGKAIETCLITGAVLNPPDSLPLHQDSRLPTFIYQLVKRLIDVETGRPLWFHPACTYFRSEAAFALLAVRQLCLAFSKVEDQGAQMTNEEAIQAFSKRVTRVVTVTTPSWVLNEARSLIKSIVMDGEELAAPLAQWESNPFGRHGPGAVAGKETGMRKWNFSDVPGSSLLYKWREELPNYAGRTPFVSRCVCVPKDFRGPRTICIEPKELQFAQQGLMDVLYDLIETNPFSGRGINFRDQRPSQRLCTDERLATIDLKDASDMVSMTLCRLLFPKAFFSLVTRYRSRQIKLPSGEVIQPTCFASMGSALCFPIETLVFWALARSCIHNRTCRLPVRVFGDDIIVPVEDGPFVTKILESAGLIVNPNKTCVRTPVRESCGAYTLYGFDVRVTRFKRSQCKDKISWIALYENGCNLSDTFKRTGRSILSLISNFVPVPSGGNLPPHDGAAASKRWNRAFQRWEVKVPTPFYRIGRSGLDGYSGLYAWLVGNSTRPNPIGDLRVKTGWKALIR